MSNTLPSAALFVDVQNIYYTCKQAFNRQFNYRYLWQSINSNYDIVLANAYAIESNNDGQHKFQTALRNIGFDIKLKPYIQRSDGSAKGDWDVGITVDVMHHAKQVEHVFLLSGDGDFDILLKYVSATFATQTHVVGVEQLTAKSLIDSCHRFSPITENQLL